MPRVQGEEAGIQEGRLKTGCRRQATGLERREDRDATGPLSFFYPIPDTLSPIPWFFRLDLICRVWIENPFGSCTLYNRGWRNGDKRNIGRRSETKSAECLVPGNPALFPDGIRPARGHRRRAGRIRRRAGLMAALSPHRRLLAFVSHRDEHGERLFRLPQGRGPGRDIRWQPGPRRGAADPEAASRGGRHSLCHRLLSGPAAGCGSRVAHFHPGRHRAARRMVLYGWSRSLQVRGPG